jgi:DNA gyrase subunit A
LLGLVVAVTNLDEVVKLIRGSASPAEAREKLLAREWPGDQIRSYIALVEAVEPQKAGESYRLSEAQVRAILELRLHRLTALGRDEIGGELEGLAKNIGELLEILGNRARLYEVMRKVRRGRSRVRNSARLPKSPLPSMAWKIEDLIGVEDMAGP